MWHWVRDFFTERSASCTMDDHREPTFSTKIGLPQRRVIAPTLFNVYILDMFAETGKKHYKFADDRTTWTTSHKVETAITEVCQNFQTVKKWCHTWRMSVSLNKTEAILFSAKPVTIKTDAFTAGNSILPYNGFPKITGNTLDERVNFDRHIQLVERKASGALKIIREVKGIASLVSTKKLINIYQSMVRSIVEYGAIIWQGAKKRLH
ncbi:uncharacterized protein LOC127853802 [Dreissena polymorpha]|uniref:uncharacterized protein LOC127853802 n=1 Tax=Dreissena polymorpha TaxID=45954 RepID=UPI0022645358|nr:uncharacterized protein LOC127853802 [Dreissena polymorpha]